MGWGAGGGVSLADSSNKGFWNANTNSPDYTTILIDDNDFLTVSVAGTRDITGLGSTTFAAGDSLVKTATGFAHIEATTLPIDLSGLEDGDVPVVSGGVLVTSSISQDSNDNVFIANELDTERRKYCDRAYYYLREEAALFQLTQKP